MNMKNKNIPIILGEDLKKSYRNAMERDIPLLPKQIKFLIIRHADEIRSHLLLFEYLHPHEYHIEALIAYMTEKKIDKIWVNGGGSFMLMTMNDTIEFSGRSVSFDNLNQEVLETIAKSYWPEHTLLFNLTNTPRFNQHNEKLHALKDLQNNIT